MDNFFRHRGRFGWLPLLGLFLVSPSLIAADAVVVQDDQYEYYNLDAYLSYLVDGSGRVTLRDALASDHWLRNTSGGVLNFGFAEQAVWLQVPLVITSPPHRRWYLVIPYPLLQNVKLYLLRQPQGTLVWQTDLRALRSGEQRLRANKLAFQLPEQLQGQFTVLLRVQSSTSLQIPVELWSRDYLVERQILEASLWGVYFGVILALLLYNSFLFISMADITYGFYVLAMLSLGGLMLAISGLGGNYLWPTRAYTREVLAISAGFSQFWLLCFCLSFLGGDRLRPVIRWALKLMCLVNLLIVAAVFWVPESGAFLAGCAGLVTVALVMLAGVTALFSGVEIARYFVFASAALAVGALLYLATVFGLLEPSTLTNHALQAGSMVEALLFSFALAHRIKEERRHKLIAMAKMEAAQQATVQVQEQALQQALHDPITRFPNEALLQKRLNEMVGSRAEYDSFALVLLYFPQFRDISSSMGRRLAEDMFTSIIERINGELNNDVQSIAIEAQPPAQVAVTEFGSLACLVRMGQGYRPVRDFVSRVMQIHGGAVEVAGTAAHIKSYCGVAMYPKHGERPDLLMQHASAALDYGRRVREVLTIYSSDIDAFGRRRLAMMGELLNAIRDRELELYLQPQFDCRRNEVWGVEVLLRWNSAKFGVVPPVEFIEVAEEAGQMAQLTRFVITESFALLREFNAAGHILSLSINLSVQNLMEAKLISFITAEADKQGINLHDVVFEVTETSSTENFNLVIDNLNQLASIGCHIALDDYGTGYSSLAYLSRLPIHELKIDRSFIVQMEHKESDYRIVDNTIKLARALQLQTVAEGVETQAALDSLVRLGCDRVQGFYLARPMPVSQFRQWGLRTTPGSQQRLQAPGGTVD